MKKYFFLFLLLASLAFAKTETIICIAGGSGAGKSTFARKLTESINSQISGAAKLLSADNYYHTEEQLSELFAEQEINFDHPRSLNFNLLTQHLESLIQGQDIQSPKRAFFNQHEGQTEDLLVTIAAHRFIVLEGLWVLNEDVRRFCTNQFFTDAPSNTRLDRRLKRDLSERSTSEQDSKNGWTNVEAMYHEHIAPTAHLPGVIKLSFTDMTELEQTVENLVAELLSL